jgi:hypothetical protein
MRWLLLIVPALALGFIVALRSRHQPDKPHPFFGQIHHSEMEEMGYQTAIQRRLRFIGGFIPRSGVRPPKALTLGTNVLPWGRFRPSSRDGEFLTHHASFTTSPDGSPPEAKPDYANFWEFGWCQRSNLAEVIPQDLYPPFKELKYASLPSNLGTGWLSNSVRVETGQVVLIRSVDARDTVYVVQVDSQDGDEMAGRIAISYVVARTNMAEPLRRANRRQH